MICPLCHAEYREGYTRCTECDVRLIEPVRLAPGKSAKRKADPPVVVWRGQDPVAFSVVVSALADANIHYLEFHNRDFTACLSQPMSLSYYGIGHSEVRVYPNDLEAAKEVVEAALQPVAQVYQREEVMEDDASSEAPETKDSPAGPHDEAAPPDKVPVEVWRGRDPERAQTLAHALDAEKITTWVLTASSGDARVLVASEDRSRAEKVLAFAAANSQA
jgi:hypothetical protein